MRVFKKQRLASKKYWSHKIFKNLKAEENFQNKKRKRWEVGEKIFKN